MTNEAKLRDRMSEPVFFGCVDGLGMLKGTILKLSGPRGVGPSGADGDIFAGILSREKIKDDGRTQVPVFIDGIFDMAFIGPAVTQGSHVTISGPNLLKVFTAGDSEDGTVVGKLIDEDTSIGTGVLSQVMIGRGP